MKIVLTTAEGQELEVLKVEVQGVEFASGFGNLTRVLCDGHPWAVRETPEKIAALVKAAAVAEERIMPLFSCAHLPEQLQAASKPFCELAERVVTILPRNPERTVALRKLLEAMDAAVRALLIEKP